MMSPDKDKTSDAPQKHRHPSKRINREHSEYRRTRIQATCPICGGKPVQRFTKEQIDRFSGKQLVYSCTCADDTFWVPAQSDIDRIEDWRRS